MKFSKFTQWLSENEVQVPRHPHDMANEIHSKASQMPREEFISWVLNDIVTPYVDKIKAEIKGMRALTAGEVAQLHHKGSHHIGPQGFYTPSMRGGFRGGKAGMLRDLQFKVDNITEKYTERSLGRWWDEANAGRQI
jgi:hypothetical protein